MNRPFHGPGGRRAVLPEIRRDIEETTGSTPVYGLSEVVEAGGAVVGGGGRISGFMETGDRREWLLPLSAGKGLTWKTAPVPESALPSVSFVLPVGFGMGSPLPQPSGRFDVFVNDRLVARGEVLVLNDNFCVRISEIVTNADARQVG